MNYLIDTHCHLDFEDFDSDRDEVIKRAYEGGVRKIINIGCDLKRARKSIEIAKSRDFIFVACGLHPQEAGDGDEFFFSQLRELLKEPKVVAIGECGLEFAVFAREQSERLQKRASVEVENEGGLQQVKFEKQKEVFIRQLELAKEFKKPAIIHCRNAYPELLDILKNEKEKNPGLCGVVHFFSGRLSHAEELFKLGFLISFTGVITFARDYDRVIKASPLEKIMIETDAPFVSPEPYRGKRNEPLYVKYVAEKIAEIKNLSFDEVARTTTKNAERLFDI